MKVNNNKAQEELMRYTRIGIAFCIIVVVLSITVMFSLNTN